MKVSERRNERGGDVTDESRHSRSYFVRSGQSSEKQGPVEDQNKLDLAVMGGEGQKRWSKTCLYLHQTAKSNISKAPEMDRCESALTPGFKSGIKALIHSNSVHFCRCKDATIALHLTSPHAGWFAAECDADKFGFWRVESACTPSE